MGYIKVPEMLSPEMIKALGGNLYADINEPSPEDEMVDTLREFFKGKKKSSNKEEKKSKPMYQNDVECCCPNKVKFIFVLNNAVVIDVNAVCEENGGLD